MEAYDKLLFEFIDLVDEKGTDSPEAKAHYLLHQNNPFFAPLALAYCRVKNTFDSNGCIRE